MTNPNTPTDELVARLTDEADMCRNDGAEDIAKLCDEAAGRIQALDAQLKAMREALEAIASNDEYPCDSEGNPMPIRPQWSAFQCSSIARAALGA